MAPASSSGNQRWLDSLGRRMLVTSATVAANLQPEEQARLLIDEQLAQAGWNVCDRAKIMEELEAAFGEFAAIVEGLGEVMA